MHLCYNTAYYVGVDKALQINMKNTITFWNCCFRGCQWIGENSFEHPTAIIDDYKEWVKLKMTGLSSAHTLNLPPQCVRVALTKEHCRVWKIHVTKVKWFRTNQLDAFLRIFSYSKHLTDNNKRTCNALFWHHFRDAVRWSMIYRVHYYS